MSFKKENYPPYWKQFSKYIRFERADGQCECAGECGRAHEQARCPQFHNQLTLFGKNHRTVILTVAHLDGLGGVCQCRRFFGFKCAKPSHVKAMCQACHLSYDKDKHVAVRKKNVARKKDSARGLLQQLF